jgi:hypothetical protein
MGAGLLLVLPTISIELLRGVDLDGDVGTLD